MNPGTGAEGSEGGDDASSAESEEGDIARLGIEDAGGCKDVEDAVGWAGLQADLAENGAVLREAPSVGRAALGDPPTVGCGGRGIWRGWGEHRKRANELGRALGP